MAFYLLKIGNLLANDVLRSHHHAQCHTAGNRDK